MRRSFQRYTSDEDAELRVLDELASRGCAGSDVGGLMTLALDDMPAAELKGALERLVEKKDAETINAFAYRVTEQGRARLNGSLS